MFGEFLNLPNINTVNAKMLATVKLFAYGTLPEYLKEQSKFVSLKPDQLRKLKLITLADTASKNPIVDYSELMEKAQINDLRQLEDALIDCMQLGLLTGKIDQRGKRLHVINTFGRDVMPDKVDGILKRLKDWDQQLLEAQSNM